MKRALQETTVDHSSLNMRMMTIGDSHAHVISERDLVLRDELEVYKERDFFCGLANSTMLDASCRK